MSNLFSFNARTGESTGEPLATSSAAQIDAAILAAHHAFGDWGRSSGAQRATLLRHLADRLEADRESLVALADLETALGPVRLNGELDRTTFQLRRFADTAQRGEPFAVLDDPAVAGAPPAGHPAMQLHRMPLGPVAMFAASNFPFAFSVLGGRHGIGARRRLPRSGQGASRSPCPVAAGVCHRRAIAPGARPACRADWHGARRGH
jgi:NADP-dependent aldehyde dehydrogenase